MQFSANPSQTRRGGTKPGTMDKLQQQRPETMDNERNFPRLFFEAMADAIADRLDHRQEARCRLLDME